jgi:hypothetical protein
MTGAPMTRTLPRARQLGSQRTDSPREVVNDASSELSLRAERRSREIKPLSPQDHPDIAAALEVVDLEEGPASVNAGDMTS